MPPSPASDAYRSYNSRHTSVFPMPPIPYRKTTPVLLKRRLSSSLTVSSRPIKWGEAETGRSFVMVSAFLCTVVCLYKGHFLSFLLNCVYSPHSPSSASQLWASMEKSLPRNAPAEKTVLVYFSCTRHHLVISIIRLVRLFQGLWASPQRYILTGYSANNVSTAFRSSSRKLSSP